MAAANSGRFAESLQAAARMKAAQVPPDTSTYNALLSLAARHASWLFSWAIVDDMLKVGFRPTQTTFAHLIDAQRHRPSTNLWTAIERMNEFDIKPNVPIYSAIINCLVAQGNIEMAVQYVFSMKEQGIIPEIATAQDVVILAAECGYSRLAIELATYFENTAIRQLESSAWISCLFSSARNLYIDGVLTCWPKVINDLNVLPDEGVCLAVLNTAARHGSPDLATEVLQVLQFTEIEWQEHHFAALIEAFCRNRQVKEALVTLHIMRTNGITPLDTTTAFIFECINHDIDALDSAWALIDEIHASDSGISIDALRVVIRASVFMGDLQRAVGIYKAFSDYGFEPDLGTFNLLLQGCITAQHRQLGDLLLADMKQFTIKPDEETYKGMILLCLTQEVYEDAFYYLEEMKAAGYVPPQDVYEALAGKCSAAADSRVDMILQEMTECGYQTGRDLLAKIRGEW
ncbi:hypothetical protein CPB84DRAFT_1682582 [Gymnopilus junonius]|uniref:Pentatricopeptide repeat-containing protein-mitochondrial domain-containing protein n=1 Tax=Gymnopilus junonius TaxID=109634 RepID=A0A9P5NK70_GYMJU|nr:hypothetical protein CPB84DRAFT_1682582 [Gymnopilus junonius]